MLCGKNLESNGGAKYNHNGIEITTTLTHYVQR